jgi:hypothetical protein
VAVEEVGLEITPEPNEAERRAIVEALGLAHGEERENGPGAWWASGAPRAEGDLEPDL